MAIKITKNVSDNTVWNTVNINIHSTVYDRQQSFVLSYTKIKPEKLRGSITLGNIIDEPDMAGKQDKNYVYFLVQKVTMIC